MRFGAVGRGRSYSWRRGVVESCLRVAYVGDWPARAWARVPGTARVREIQLELPLLPGPRSRPALRLAFVSDLHLGPTTPRATLDAAFAAIARAEPDVLLLGGDYVFLDATRAKARELEERVRDVPARVKVAVLGNHDLWTHHGRIEDALGRAGAHVLVNDAVRLGGRHDDVAIAGIDDAWTGDADAARAVGAAGGAALVVGLAHSPEGAELLGHAGVPLVLCGHTHGGQVALPGGRPIVVPGAVGRRHPWGLARLGGALVLVSRGVGGIEIPVRAWAPPDVAIVTLMPLA